LLRVRKTTVRFSLFAYNAIADSARKRRRFPVLWKTLKRADSSFLRIVRCNLAREGSACIGNNAEAAYSIGVFMRASWASPSMNPLLSCFSGTGGARIERFFAADRAKIVEYFKGITCKFRQILINIRENPNAVWML
jgi:hypothetical protein